MNEEKLNEKFRNWNPMENDYKNEKFNQYETGPGADLDKELQPGSQAMNSGNGNKKYSKNPTLVFRHIPTGMTLNALRNICSRHGRVVDARDSNKCDYYFVELATVADLEAVFRALENNDYGFKVIVGKSNSRETMSTLEKLRLGNQDGPVVPVAPKETGIDYESRNFRTSGKKLPRPIVEEDKFISGIKASGICLTLLENDAHTLERQGLYKMQNKNNFSYQNGRSYFNMPENTKKFVDQKHAESSGVYNDRADKFIKPFEDFEKPNIGECLQCGRNTDNICSRCSQYYCNTECQIKNWPQHRYICGKPKHLQIKRPAKTVQKSTNNEVKSLKQSPGQKNINSNNSKSESKSTFSTAASVPSNMDNNNSPDNSTDKGNYKHDLPRSGNIVTITAIVKTNVVFIRSKTYDDNLSYFNTVNALQAIGKNLKPLQNAPKCGTMVIAKTEDQYNRALVLHIKSLDNIVVNFMDYGNLNYMKMQDLYEAPVEFVNKPRHALPVVLKDVPETYMTKEIRNFMYTYLNNINVEIRYKQEDYRADTCVYSVELIDENTQQNLNKIIVKLATPKEPKIADDFCMRGYLEHKLLPSGENVELFVMDNSLMVSGCISCTTKPYAIEIQKFQLDLQEYAKSASNAAYTPRVDELCIARYSEDGLWYRGYCLETVGDGHPSIHFIDYGNIDVVPIEDIRRYPRQFTFPIYTADCEIQGLPESCNEELVAKLEELIPYGEIIKCANVKAFEEDRFYSLYLPNVIKELTDNGLI